MVPLDDATQRPIGVFDSGFGGLTVVSALKRRLPQERILYLGDTARLPYGTKSECTVIRYTRQIVRFLICQHVKYVVAACNTASALALRHVGDACPVPITGVVEPGAGVAVRVTRSGLTGVLGTLSTIRSGAYEEAIHRIDPGVVVTGQACPLLVPLVEEGWTRHCVARQVIRHYLTELKAAAGDLDTIVLGCTHYPLLAETIQAEADQLFDGAVQLVDSANAVAEAVAADLRGRGLLCRSGASSTQDRFLFTDTNRFGEVAAGFLGRAVPRCQRVDIQPADYDGEGP